VAGIVGVVVAVTVNAHKWN